MCKLCMRFDVRKVDYKTDEKLRSLLEDICEKDEYQSLGIISFLEPNGRPGSTAAVEEHCPYGIITTNRKSPIYQGFEGFPSAF